MGNNWGVAIVIGLCVLLAAGCSGENKPTEAELRDALTVELPGYLKVTDFSVEAMQNTGNEVEPRYVARFNASLEVTSPLYTRDGTEGKLLFLQPAEEEGAEVEVFGKSTSVLFQGAWAHDLYVDGNTVSSMGRPRDEFANAKTIVRGSAEETEHFDALRAANEEFEATLRELPVDEMVTKYYNSSGPYAGRFVIHEVLASRSEKVSPEEFRVHAKYSYRQPNDTGPQGEDRRMFIFRKPEDTWQVVSIGPARSGRIE